MAVRNIKLCLVVDKHTYPERVFPSKKERELLEKADAISLRHPPYLRALLDIHEKKISGVELPEAERELLQEVAKAGKEIIYHNGSGIVEEHIFHVPNKGRENEVIRDDGFPKFIADGNFELLNKLGINYASFNLGASVKNVYVYTKMEVPGEKGYLR